MRKIIFTLSLLFTIAMGYAQSLPDYDAIPLKAAGDYKPAEGAALQASNYLLSIPVRTDTVEEAKSAAFLIKWMMGTPDYTFSMESTEEIMGNDDNIMTIYMAAMTKFCLENKGLAKDQAAVKVGTWKIIADYIDNPAHKVKQTKKMKKLIEANKSGKLEEFLKDK